MEMENRHSRTLIFFYRQNSFSNISENLELFERARTLSIV